MLGLRTCGEVRLNLVPVAYGLLVFILLLLLMLVWSIGQMFHLFFGNGDKQAAQDAINDSGRGDV